MVGDFLGKLAVALPLICLLAFFSILFLKKRGVGFPSLMLRNNSGGEAATPTLELLASKSLSPTARVAIIRFDGRQHLIGVSGQQISVLASASLADAPNEGGSA